VSPNDDAWFKLVSFSFLMTALYLNFSDTFRRPDIGAWLHIFHPSTVA
jgi:hypothetical protein